MNYPYLSTKAAKQLGFDLSQRIDVQIPNILAKPKRSSKGLRELQQLAKMGVSCYPKRPLSYSSLKAYHSKGMMGYLDYVMDKSKTSVQMTKGSLFESLLFGEKWEDLFVVWEKPFPESNMNKKENKAARAMAEAEALATERELIERKDFEQTRAQIEGALNHPLMKRAQKYKTLRRPKKKIFREPISGLKITGIPDLDINRGRTGIDIKNGASLALWKKRLFSRDDCMWMQAGMYGIIYNYRDFYFFTNKNKGLNFSRAYYISPEVMQVMKEKVITEVLIPFKQELQKGFGLYEETVQLPSWFASS